MEPKKSSVTWPVFIAYQEILGPHNMRGPRPFFAACLSLGALCDACVSEFYGLVKDFLPQNLKLVLFGAHGKHWVY